MEINGYAVISRLFDGEFLPYNKAIPQQITSTVRVRTREFIDAVERASLVINDRIKSPLVSEFRDNQIILSCITPIGQRLRHHQRRVEGERWRKWALTAVFA